MRRGASDASGFAGVGWGVEEYDRQFFLLALFLGIQVYSCIGNDGTAPPNLELYIATAVLASGTIVGGIAENRACIVWGLLYTPEELEP